MSKVKKRLKKIYRNEDMFDVDVVFCLFVSILLGGVYGVLEVLLDSFIIDIFNTKPKLIAVNGAFFVVFIITNWCLAFATLMHFNYKDFIKRRRKRREFLLEVRAEKIKMQIDKYKIHNVKFTDLNGLVHNLEIEIKKRTKYYRGHYGSGIIGVSKTIINSDTIPCSIDGNWEFEIRTNDETLEDYISRISEDLAETLDSLCKVEDKKRRFRIEQ